MYKKLTRKKEKIVYFEICGLVLFQIFLIFNFLTTSIDCFYIFLLLDNEYHSGAPIIGNIDLSVAWEASTR